MSDKELTEKARELKNAYQREWNRKNPERVKEIRRNYWKRKVLKMEQEKEADK